MSPGRLSIPLMMLGQCEEEGDMKSNDIMTSKDDGECIRKIRTEDAERPGMSVNCV